MENTIRLNGYDCRIVWSRERQILEGVEHLVVVDPDKQEIRLCAALRKVIADAVSVARVVERELPRKIRRGMVA